MIIAEIKKGGQVYEFTLNDFQDLNAAHEFIREVATGKSDFISQEQVIDLGTSQDYEHIRVWMDQAFSVVDPAADLPVLEDSKNYVRGFFDRISFLGQDLSINGVKALEDGVAFVLIYEINNQPAHVVAGKDSLKNVTYHQGLILGYKDPTPIVAPADLLTEEAAIEYVEDYIKELKKKADDIRVNKTATAYYGFTKEGE
ncbi:hypothetical protein [Cytobacillus praedii]|uniref:hypothetical protein n=1 Tax=Cytobacillus praedii TaxID=1742358 RepID=UPI002E1AF127|nr:hypothetical protein [Cytobacillus praedii]